MSNNGTQAKSAASRAAMLSYGVICYLVFFVTFVYAIGFIGGFGTPTSLDAAPAADSSLLFAIFVNVGLLGLFAVQHSVMARPAFKRAWTKIVPAAAERSTYVLFSSVALIALFIAWQPIGGVVWQVEGSLASGVLYGAYALGWVVVFVSTCLINHFDLFGLRQVWLYFRNEPYTDLKFVTPWPYRVIRHPLYLGWLLVMWCTPTMTSAHALFALLSTGYIFIGIWLEERDLVAVHPDYAAYRDQVPMIVPKIAVAPQPPATPQEA